MRTLLDAAGELPDQILLDLATALAWCRPLQPYPGWRFDIDWDRNDVGCKLRRALWQEAHDRRLRQPIVIPWYHGLRLQVFLGNDISRQVYVGGCIDPNELAFVDRFLRAGETFVDVGANEGLYSLLAAAKVGRQGRVIAVEPSPRDRERLRANMALNALDTVQPITAALGAATGQASLRIAGYGHEGQNTLSRFVYDVPQEGTLTVPVQRLDDLAEQCQLQRLDLLKVDVEGADTAVLEGGGQILARHRPAILVEVHDGALQTQGSSAAALLAQVRAANYRWFDFDSTSGRLVPLSDVATATGINLLAWPSERSPERLLTPTS